MVNDENVAKWDHRFLGLAKYVSAWSRDPSTKFGAVIARGKRPLSLGFNGLPQGIEDTEERLNNRDLKYELIVHGELNALHFADGELTGCTLYAYPFMPCSRCAGQFIQRKISRVVSLCNDNPRWVDSFKLSTEIFKEAGVELVLYKYIVEVM